MTPQRRHSLIWLSICSFTLLAATLLPYEPESPSAGPWAVHCAFHEGTRLPCPGCGLTRGTISVMHAEWSAALGYHPGAFVVVLLCGLGVVAHSRVLYSNRRPSYHARLARAGYSIFLLGILLPWIWGLLGRVLD